MKKIVRFFKTLLTRNIKDLNTNKVFIGSELSFNLNLKVEDNSV